MNPMKMLSPTLDQFYAEFPYWREALRLYQPPAVGEEYEEQRKAYATLLREITKAYTLWCANKPLVWEVTKEEAARVHI